jgi:hypothetical protein
MDKMEIEQECGCQAHVILRETVTEAVAASEGKT